MSHQQSVYSYSTGSSYDRDDESPEGDDSDDQTSSEHAYPYAIATRPSDLSDYRRISRAVDRLQDQYSTSSSESIEAQGPQTQSQTLRLASQGLRVSPNASPTTNPLEGHQPHTIKYLDNIGQESSSGASTSQRQITYLPTIDSGQPLDFDDLYHPNIDPQDPFIDNVVQHRPTSNQISFNPRPVSQVSAYEDTRRTSPAYVQPTIPTYPISYAQQQQASLQTPDRLYQRKGVSPMHTGSPQYIDHFRHDTEARAHQRPQLVRMNMT
ncbi:hypothetical protein OF83DRAFT_1176731 [Amylostereum chailletii]|nr:hypothetical protein OF83DRAFT_1176731 [Amylostereum chailletii]